MDLLKKVENEFNKINCESESCGKCKRNHLDICVKDAYSYLKSLYPSVGSIVKVIDSDQLYTTYYEMLDIMDITPSLAAMYTDKVRPFAKYRVIAVADHEDIDELVFCLKAVDYFEIILIGADGIEIIG